jgi:hypothetical protein
VGYIRHSGPASSARSEQCESLFPPLIHLVKDLAVPARASGIYSAAGAGFHAGTKGVAPKPHKLFF